MNKPPATLPKNVQDLNRAPARPFKEVKKPPATLPKNAQDLNRAPARPPKNNTLRP